MPYWQLIIPWFLAIVLVGLTIYLVWSRDRILGGVKELSQFLESHANKPTPLIPFHLIHRDLGHLADAVQRIGIESETKKNSPLGTAKLFNSVIEELNDALVVVSEDLRVTHFNTAAKELFLRPTFTRGNHLIGLCGNQNIVKLTANCLANEEASKEVIHFSGGNRNGKQLGERFLEVETAPLDKLLGGGAWILIRDISKAVHTEQIRKDFVANASHELRTPLTIINGYIENLKDGGISNPAFAKRALEIMGKHGDRLSLLIEDMLLLSRLDSGPRLDLTSFDFGECAAGVLETTIVHCSQSSSTKILAAPEPGKCPMIGDPLFWEQILVNLIANAIKENPPGVGVGISWHATPDEWQIRVWDNGIGIPSAHLPFIFKRFYRVEKHHTQSATKGTGLGLSIVKRAVEALGGTIRVESCSGERTEFLIDVKRPTPIEPPAL